MLRLYPITFRAKERASCKKTYYTEAGQKGSRRRYLKRQYGISIDEYNLMFEVQQGKCAICGKHQTELKGVLVVDHCHETGKIRGLLCNDCNKGLGNFADDIENINCAIIYLNESKKCQ